LILWWALLTEPAGHLPASSPEPSAGWLPGTVSLLTSPPSSQVGTPLTHIISSPLPLPG
ncbi:hypothetical protein DSO57_1030981, partial [Entomophthora muscae]